MISSDVSSQTVPIIVPVFTTWYVQYDGTWITLGSLAIDSQVGLDKIVMVRVTAEARAAAVQCYITLHGVIRR